MLSALAVAPGGLLAVVDDALGSVAGTNLQVLARGGTSAAEYPEDGEYATVHVWGGFKAELAEQLG